MNPDPRARWWATVAGDACRSHLQVGAVVALGGAHGLERHRLTADDGERRVDFFVKSGRDPHSAQLSAEADGLAALRQADAVRVPTVIALASDEPENDAGHGSCLILEWLDLVPLDPASARRLGAALARLHAVAGPRFGWPRDNFLGATPQTNEWAEDWLTFLRERRLLPQLRLAARRRLPTRLIDRGERLLADCEPFYRGHVPRASLVHGDLWAGNAAALVDGTPVLFDPACHYGDRESDLAMTELFGGFPDDFHAAYRSHAPLTDGYPVRRDMVQAYHLLNHANLFGGDYVRQTEHHIDRLLAELG